MAEAPEKGKHDWLKPVIATAVITPILSAVFSLIAVATFIGNGSKRGTDLLADVGKAEERLRQDQQRIEKLEPLIDRLEKVQNQKVDDVMKVLERPDTDKLEATARMDDLEVRIDYMARMAQKFKEQNLPWYSTRESDNLMMQAEAQVTKDQKAAMAGKK